MTAALVLLAALVAWNAWVTRRIVRSDLDRGRKTLFVAAVWLFPVFGPLSLRDVGRSPASDWKERDGEAVAAPATVDAGTSVIDLRDLLVPQAPFPLLDGERLEQRLAQQPAEARPAVRDAARRAWLLHLRDALGDHFHFHASDNAMLVGSLLPSDAQAMLRSIGRARGRILRVLDGVAAFPAREPSVLVVFDDEESYYQYVAMFYPEDGEFGFSGGMFIDAGCPHFVVRRADLLAIEPVIAHELTHSALSHLQLPLWLDEGLAVNTERRVTTPGANRYTAAELHGMHLRFWDAKRIQEFWSGRSFQRTDEGQVLSYELARVLVDQFARDWQTFADFVRSARRGDAGHAAAAAALGLDLGSAVQALFGSGDEASWAPDPAAWEAEARPA